MSVMGCDRKGCPNIMCDWLSYNYGYLCNECHTELGEKVQDIRAFMVSEKVDDTYAMEDHARRVEREFKRHL